MRPNRARTTWQWLFALFLLPSVALAQATGGVGFQAIETHDPVTGAEMPGYVFYPATTAASVTWRGPYAVAASLGAPPLPGAKPLVVISHGNGGSDLGHHDLATYLAGHGFVVATLEHPKDNFHDQSGVGHAEVLGGRAVQVSATISMLLADPHWKALIDPSRIGVAGFSAGGYTSLLLVGAVPRFQRFLPYCRKHRSDDPAVCGHMDDMQAEAARHGQTLEQFAASLQHDYTRWGPTADPRVKAAFAMAPLSLIFDQAGTAAIDRPVFLYYGSDDHVLLPADNAAHIRPWIKPLAGVKVVAGADHWVFLAPCSPALAQEAKDICSDPPGIDRAKLHAQIDADALTFFRQSLAAPAH